MVEPNCMKFKTLKVLPNLVAPNTENEDPKRMKLLILMLLEKEVWSLTLKSLPYQALPQTERVEPNLLKLLTVSVEPMCTKSSTDILDPRRAIP
jgi:hypothetical protein